jgi:hypothetical protein
MIDIADKTKKVLSISPSYCGNFSSSFVTRAA